MKKIAVIGSGIAGLSCAHYLKDDFHITLFEKNNYIGGHTNTVKVNDGKNDCYLDTGFMVFNEVTYPYLQKLFKELNVDYYNTDMSFSYHSNSNNLQFNGSSVGGLFIQKRNIFNFSHWKLLFEINKFNKICNAQLDEIEFLDLTVEEFCKEQKLSNHFLQNYLIPMSSAVWSAETSDVLSFPIKTLAKFFYNHGFLGLNTQLQWKTVTGGSQQYVKKILETKKINVKKGATVKSIEKINSKLNVQFQEISSEGSELYDYVILATHADEARKIIEKSFPEKAKLLSAFRYNENLATVHTDEAVMPSIRKNWSSWNSIENKNKKYSVYFMNKLQNVSDKMNFFVNINGEEFINKKKILYQITYHHPQFDNQAIKAQDELPELNKGSQLLLCGSYFKYGFHEDALSSGLQAVKQLLETENESCRFSQK